MKKILLLFLFALSLRAQTVTQAEYFWNTDPGVGNGTSITISADDSVSITNQWIQTAGLPLGINKFWIRYRGSNGLWGRLEGRNFVIKGPSNTVISRTVTQAEYWFDNDAHTALDLSDGQEVNLEQIISTASLSRGIHSLSVRYLGDNNLWSSRELRYFAVESDRPAPVVRYVTQAEYWFDNDAHTALDLSDGQEVNLEQIISTASLSRGIHSLSVRYLGDNNLWSSRELRYFVTESDRPAPLIRYVTLVEYWFDSASPTQVDLTDGSQINFNELLPSASLTLGAHVLHLRFLDDHGTWTPQEQRQFVVVTPRPGNPASLYIAAAEFYVNVDPGEGNGVSIPLPQDAIWDEGAEDPIGMITGVPVGIHVVGIRVKDNRNIWSRAEKDTFLVGPIVTIRPSGDDIILDWQCDLSGAPFHVYRADSLSGSFGEIGTSNLLNYTDLGIITTSAARKFYQVKFTDSGALSSFRLPPISR